MSERSESIIYPPTVAEFDDSDLNPLEMLITIGRHKWLVFGLPILSGIVAFAIASQMTPVFTSYARMMPPQQQNSSALALLGSLGGMAGNMSGLGGLKNPNDLYIGLLESRTVADRLIARFDLMKRNGDSTMDDARARLASMRDVSIGKRDSLITISVNDHDPVFAATLANGFVDELSALTSTMAVTEAGQRRMFFEKQLKQAKDELADAEIALRSTQEKTGMIQPQAQVGAVIASVAQLRSAIAGKEVELAAMRSFATNQNPELVRAQQELRGLQAQLAKVGSQSSIGDDTLASTGKLPAAGVEFVRGARNVKYYESIYEVIAKQYEMAKIDESHDASSIQVLDRAVPAARKSGPRRGLITLAAMLGGGMLGIILAFLHGSYQSAQRRPDSQQRWQRVRSAWTGRQR
jgi:uncharacterized protein involved in exopolysaccharide biosynthesis